MREKVRSSIEHIKNDVKERRFGRALLSISNLRNRITSDRLYAAEKSLAEWLDGFHSGTVDRMELEMREEVIGLLKEIE